NHAATRISLGWMKEALGDCLTAENIDPSFLKAQVRATLFYIATGEIENAKKRYPKCLQSGIDNRVDTNVIAHASKGLPKALAVFGNKHFGAFWSNKQQASRKCLQVFMKLSYFTICAEMDDPDNAHLLAEEIIDRAEAKEAAERKRKMVIDEKQFHQELKTEMKGMQKSSDATEIKETDEQDDADDVSSNQLIKDEEEMAMLPLSR
ncbi:DnaJ domain, tetratricopeptide-like helical domain protein, partial [Tanacetum coccineum]